MSLLSRLSAAFILLFPASDVILSGSNLVSRSIGPDFFGMDVMEPKMWPEAPIGALGKGAGTTWRYLEPARGVYKWYGTDTYVQAAERHGVDVLYTFDATPQWASARPEESCYAGPIGCAAPPSNIQDWEDFVRAVVTRYKGRIKIYELWNEPTTQQEWSGTYAEMIKLARSAYKIIKSMDPSAILLTPAPSAHGYQPRRITSAIQPDWMREYLKAGGDSFADAGSWHAAPWPNACRETLDCAGTPLIKQIEAMRSVFDHSGLAGKPIYVTEGGWRTDTELADRDQQAAYLSRWYILLASEGISRAYWHAWDDDRWGTLWDPVSGIRKPGIAYQQTYQWLNGANIGACRASSTELWTCELTRVGGYQGLLVWKTAGTERYLAPAHYKSYRDLEGRVMPVDGPVIAGIKPILFETSTPESH
jgi:hypothetical protein